jgi:hypothetical protein
MSQFEVESKIPNIVRLNNVGKRMNTTSASAGPIKAKVPRRPSVTMRLILLVPVLVLLALTWAPVGLAILFKIGSLMNGAAIFWVPCLLCATYSVAVAERRFFFVLLAIFAVILILNLAGMSTYIGGLRGAH